MEGGSPLARKACIAIRYIRRETSLEHVKEPHQRVSSTVERKSNKGTGVPPTHQLNIRQTRPNAGDPHCVSAGSRETRSSYAVRLAPCVFVHIEGEVGMT